MSWLGRRPRSAFVLGAAIAAFAASACFGGPAPAPPPDQPPPPSQQPPPPPPPPGPQACQSAGAASPTAGKDEPSRPPSDRPIPPDEAGAQAREAASTTEVRTKNGEIPIVTVEEKGGKPEITSTPVRSPDEAASVAEQKAANGDLHAVDVDRPVKSLANPDDPLFAQQWSFSEVPYVSAWATDGTQGAGIKVADVDTGVMANHPDLSGQVLTGEYFLHSSDGSAAFSGTGGTTDPSGHGTHVSGIIAALSNNNTGVSGTAPGVKILPVQVLCGDGGGFASDVASGITWAVDNGAKVVNLSLGGGADSAYLTAIQYADSHNVVVVAAGGNDGTNGPASYPAAYSTSQGNLIAVAATTNANPPGHPSYGTSGSHAGYLDISAPGGSACGCGSSGDVLSTWNDGGYRSIAGTSMATPHVSAAAALLMAAASCTDSQVKTRLKATAVDLGAPGNDTTFGAGLVDPNAAAKSCT
jgi:serine protease